MSRLAGKQIMGVEREFVVGICGEREMWARLEICLGGPTTTFFAGLHLSVLMRKYITELLHIHT